MKRLSLATALLLLITAGSLRAQEYGGRTGLPGDNLNLYAVLRVFQESPTLEEFENKLNSPDELINNLDLNGDRKIDYISVVDYPDGNNHNIVLRVAVNRRENQDVAVISVYRDRGDNVSVQITGDPDLYGEDYIIEPNYYDERDSYSTPNPGYRGEVTYVTGREVYAWPIISFIFAPNYNRWVSPWYWGFYPRYWRPWTPYYWDYYYGYHNNWMRHYLRHFRIWHVHRVPNWHDRYIPIRNHSKIVITKRERGEYNRTYSRPDLRKKGDDRYRLEFRDRDRRPDNDNRRPDVNRRPDNDNRRPEMERKPARDDNRRPDVNRRPDNDNRRPEMERKPARDDNRRPDVNRRPDNDNRRPEMERKPAKDNNRKSEVKKPESRKSETKKPDTKKSETKSSESNAGRRSRTR